MDSEEERRDVGDLKTTQDWKRKSVWTRITHKITLKREKPKEKLRSVVVDPKKDYTETYIDISPPSSPRSNSSEHSLINFNDLVEVDSQSFSPTETVVASRSPTPISQDPTLIPDPFIDLSEIFDYSGGELDC